MHHLTFIFNLKVYLRVLQNGEDSDKLILFCFPFPSSRDHVDALWHQEMCCSKQTFIPDHLVHGTHKMTSWPEDKYFLCLTMFTHVWYSPYMSCFFLHLYDLHFLLLIVCTELSLTDIWLWRFIAHSTTTDSLALSIFAWPSLAEGGVCTDIKFQSLRASNVWLSWFV